jgi:glucokinase
MILAGDIGGTKTVLALVQPENGGQIVREQSFASGEYAQFNDILELFLIDRPEISAACFGIAGPVINQCCQTTNLPWLLDGEQLKQYLDTPKVRLLNDLEAMALGMLHLADDELIELNPDAQPQSGTIAVIAAGTGLGEAVLHWDGERYIPIATEGGHCSFAPQTAQQDGLLVYLRQLFPHHVSYERLVSGIGFSHIYDFVVASGFAAACPIIPPAHPTPEQDRNALISRLGIQGEDPACAETVRLFAEIYAAEAGNLALKCFASGGVYIGGGIGPKIRPILESGVFLKAFVQKGRFQNFLGALPVKLALNPRTPLLGAMHYFDAGS